MYAALVAAAGYLPLTLSGEEYLEPPRPAEAPARGRLHAGVQLRGDAVVDLEDSTSGDTSMWRRLAMTSRRVMALVARSGFSAVELTGGHRLRSRLANC